MPARQLSPSEMEEVHNMAAECGLNPDRLPVYFAELIRLREFADVAKHHHRRLPLKVQEAYVRAIAPKASIAELVEIGNEEAIEHQLHDFSPKPRA